MSFSNNFEEFSINALKNSAMFLKKFLKSSDTTVLSVAPPAGVQAMGVSLQHKFAKGINYNSTLHYFKVMFYLPYKFTQNNFFIS